MQTVEDLLKSLFHPKPEGPDPKIQMEYDQVNQNFRMLADIRFKLLALVPPLGGVAIFALSKMATPEGLPPSQYALALLISMLGFLATLGITFYDQRNSELYNALGGRANHLEYRARLDLNPTLGPSKEEYAGQFIERPNPDRRLMGIPLFLMKHDRGLALIYGPILGAWFFPLTYAVLGWADNTPKGARPWIAIGVAAFMVIIFIGELLRLDNTFSDSRVGTIIIDYNPTTRVLLLEYTVRDRKETFTGKLRRFRCKVKTKDDSKNLELGACVSVRYKKYRKAEICKPELDRNHELDTPPTKLTMKAFRVFSVRVLHNPSKQRCTEPKRA